MSNFKAKMHKSFVGWGTATDPTGVAYSTPQTRYLDFRAYL